MQRVLSWPRLYPHDPNASHLAKAATAMSATPAHPAHPFGSLLRRHRQAAGLTQEELAERLEALERGLEAARAREKLASALRTLPHAADDPHDHPHDQPYALSVRNLLFVTYILLVSYLLADRS
jgi:hypothetical protein